MKSLFLILSVLLFSTCASCQQETQEKQSPYTFKKDDPYGIGKWYMGREIAHVMGFHGMDWLERSERDEEENVSKLIRNLKIEKGDTIADIGAGSGYHTFRMAPLTGSGVIYAVDIQDEMLEVMEKKKRDTGSENVITVMGTEKSINLPEGVLDKVLMVDVYHEFEFPQEMMASVKESLKANGKVYLVEYRKEDAWVPIKEIHKMTEAQAVKEMKAAGFILERNIGNLPWQHCMVFKKR